MLNSGKKLITRLQFLVSNTKGAGMMIFILVFGSVSLTIIILGVATYGLTEHRASLRKHVRDQAFHVAEAGAHYYRWHLAHDPEDYQDGTGEEGPYLHNYEDKDGNIVGQYVLDIVEPLDGSTVVTISSTGWMLTHPEVQRTVRIRVGFPALTDYAFVQNADLNFSETTEIHGKVHSNGDIVFDGTTDASVNAVGTITGSGGPQAFWNFPVPWIDFNGISADLSDLQTMAQSGGIELLSSGDEGYYIEFLADGTFDLYRVDSVTCYYGLGYVWNWWWVGDIHCYDIDQTTFIQNYAIPSNGAIFVDDHVWVDGVVNGRVTIGVRRLPDVPSKYRNIYISGNLTYLEQSSDDVLGLIAQGNIIVPKNVPDDMTVHAAALSQNGQIYRPYYDPSFYGDSVRNSLLFFGSQISFAGGGWKYVSGGTVVSGFVNTTHTYDGNLRYLPPPGFPVGDTYDLISWEEVE